MVSGERASKAQNRGPVLQCIQPSELWASKHGADWHSRKPFHTDWLWSAHIHYLSTDWTAGRRFGRGQQSTHDRVSGTLGILSVPPTILCGLSATWKLITDIAPEGRYPKDNSSGFYCVRFAHSSDIFPDVGDLRETAWLRHLYSCSEICPCHIDPRCRIGTSSSTF